MAVRPNSPLPCRRAPEPFVPGRYVTDGYRLFRVVSRFTTTLCPFAELEDCQTLRVRRYSPNELHGMRLRGVPMADMGIRAEHVDGL